MGVQEMALMLLGIGIISEQFGGGRGLQELGKGVQAIVAAPLMGTGTGLGSLAGGLRSLAESFGDIGRGLGALFEAIPRGPITGIPFAPIVQPAPAPAPSPAPIPFFQIAAPLSPDSGGSTPTSLAGGGGNVPPSNGIIVRGPVLAPPLLPSPPDPARDTGSSPTMRYYHVL